ncbi:MAG: SDR family oxidoreductase [Gammaproteobacteria bacterium]|nr:SDR family oxidoreductase [Gammaproteobacteria bacterium]
MDTDLRNKGILVTGGAGGIGQAVVRAFASEGARVAIHYRASEAAALALAAEVGGVALGADLRLEEEADELVPRAVEALGSLSVCVANAGVWPSEDLRLWELPLARWEETIRANLTATFLTVRAFLRHAEKTRTGSIVMVGSTAGVFGEAGHVDYAAAKGGVMTGLLLSAKNEAARLGVRVNAVAPGWTVTPMTTEARKDPTLERLVTSTMALKKLGTPEDVAAQIVALASDTVSGHVTGQVVVVAGGMEGRLLQD